MQFTNTIRIDRPTAEVFAYLADPENIPQWNYAISETKKTSEGPVGVGSSYLQTRTVPEHSEETVEVTEYEPDRRFAIRGDLGPFHGDVAYVLDPAQGGTIVTNAMDLKAAGPARPIAPLAVTRVKAAVAANLGTLKTLLEKE
ncbi:SRPBCC family protein [Glycomyces sp. TRM65418]|uniref:SRPBCC family protein n=1 Tax=Glycomyces sp. TRM65418 TaxID=2867006 RepID=UPI001CE6DB7D|nr:SRPBCC family protein [Glycomyces sp. TRM65418]MCC3763358.1 SRPBCC family protein [Glycomyces sp. TRM65418]QZD57351.1 SRPBCC family protein [Glycomyces sp. TRM65418]